MSINLNTLVWIIASLLLAGFFAGIEVAFSRLNIINVELKKKLGKKSGFLFSQFIENPALFIGIVLVGFNFFLVVFGLLIGQLLQPAWNHLISIMKWPAAWVYLIKLGFETIVASFIVLLIGEFIPRAIWRAKNEWLLSGFVASIIKFWQQLFQPIANFFVIASEWILKYIFNVRVDDKKGAFSRADLETYFNENRFAENNQEGLNASLVENVLALPGIKIRKCLIPRKEIIGVDSKTSMEEVRQKFIDHKLSKLVVYENSIDQIVGYIHQMELFGKHHSIEEMLLPIPAVPESMSVNDLIHKFNRERKTMAWVVDEFGGTAGIITMEDLLEQIFGELKDEYDTEEFEEQKLTDEEYFFSGRLELDYLNDKYQLNFPVTRAETLSGYIIGRHERIPRVKERIIIGDYEFDIQSVAETRIEMVRVKRLK
jgi:CBS domain containing-hemolysin-like protein